MGQLAYFGPAKHLAPPQVEQVLRERARARTFSVIRVVQTEGLAAEARPDTYMSCHQQPPLTNNRHTRPTKKPRTLFAYRAVYLQPLATVNQIYGQLSLSRQRDRTLGRGASGPQQRP
jgi:hypothetical protein